MTDPAPAELLPWDSEWFGQTIARAGGPLTASRARELLDWCRTEGVECLYFLAPDRSESRRAAEDHGFRLVDLRVTFDQDLGGVDRKMPPECRLAAEEDVPALRAIARSAHRDTRFYQDDGFSRERCDALYETWIEKSVRGWAQAVLVAAPDGPALGYVSCHLDSPRAGRIGLVGVGDESRGRGLGRALVAGSLAWFAAQGVSTVSVVAQGRNTAALRLYGRAGFLTRDIGLWYHLRPAVRP